MCPKLRRLELPSFKGTAAVGNGIAAAKEKAAAGERPWPALRYLRLGDEMGPEHPPAALVDVLVKTLGTLETVGQVVRIGHQRYQRDELWCDRSFTRAWMEAVEYRQQQGRDGAPALRYVSHSMRMCWSQARVMAYGHVRSRDPGRRLNNAFT
jgi:hypothetical protein